MNEERKIHWEKIYATRPLEEVSWYQPHPEVSLRLTEACQVPKDAPVIDVGGGDSLLVDALLDQGYTAVHVLDISGKAIERAQRRLGERATMVRWIESDVLDFSPGEPFAIWHDRAAFHFLTDDAAISRYREIVEQVLPAGAWFILGTFSSRGPAHCSGLSVHRYSEADMEALFGEGFQRVECFEDEHVTPAHAVQCFEFCRFRRK